VAEALRLYAGLPLETRQAVLALRTAAGLERIPLPAHRRTCEVSLEIVARRGGQGSGRSIGHTAATTRRTTAHPTTASAIPAGMSIT